MVTYRWRGHVGHREDVDVGVKRKDDLNLWKKRDPIARLAKGMEKKKWLKTEELQRWKKEAEAAVHKAWDQATLDPYPKPEALLDRVYFKGAQV
jgi:pyruvate dehydrogenase E1 component alpha subunit